MQIQVNAHTRGLNTLGQLEIIVEIVRAIAGVYPHPLSDRVDAIVDQNILQCLGLAIQILIADAGIFLDQKGGDIRPAVGQGGAAEQRQCREKQRVDHHGCHRRSPLMSPVITLTVGSSGSRESSLAPELFLKGVIDWPRRAIVHWVRLANDTEKAKDNICPYRLNTTGVLHVLINAGRQSASGHASRDTKCFQSAEPLVEEPDTVRADRPVARPNPLFSILRRAVGFDLR